MMQNEKRPTAQALLLTSIICLSSCNGLTIKTWLIDALGEKSLVRKNADGTLAEKVSYVEANGYRCYSPVDDEAWRTRLAECCAQAMGGR